VLLRLLLEKKQSTLKPHITKYIAALLVGVSNASFCQVVDIKASVNTTGYVYETQIGENEATQNESILIRPSIVGNYTSRILSASLTANHSIIKKPSESNIDSESQNFTELRYNSSLMLIKNVMGLSFSGSQNYRIVSQDQNYFADKILDSGQLTKSQRHVATFNFMTPNSSYLGVNFQTSYSKTDTEESITNISGIDGSNLSSYLRFFQGSRAERYSFDISAQYNDTSRGLRQDFKSTILQGTIGIALSNKTQFIVVGSSSDYDADLSLSNSNRPITDTTSLGLGFQWQPLNERIIKLTYNQLDERENKTDYIGLNINWALSSRTALKADYSKKFYGDAYALNFDYNLKSFRSSIQYDEEVTTFSRLNSTSDSGIFVCELGSTDLLTCFQPDSIDYILQAGEEFRNTTQFDTDISDEVLFRKTGSINLGYDKRKLSTSLNLAYSRTEYLESSRVQTNKSIFLNIAYKLSKKTNVTFSTKRARRTFDGVFIGQTETTVDLNMNRNITRNLKLNLGARLLNRDRDVDTDLERPDVSDKRLTMGVTYTFY
jgi:uncharacterized protein (PEP-CTERM system associated)